MVDPNTRQGKRTPVTLKIKFKSETLEQFIERYAVDVSQGGIFIRTKEPLAVGTQMKFEFQLRDASPLIAGEGTVVWTRENDPSRPAIAPGMGVRFDRLADGSQSVLERILAEKAKQAPQRPLKETTKPPLFTDTPTRVAPAPIQEALLGGSGGSKMPMRSRADSQETPLPKPMPFHSDADDFSEEAFEEATKVRALDELVAQTAVDDSGKPLPDDELAARRALFNTPEPVKPAAAIPGVPTGPTTAGMPVGVVPPFAPAPIPPTPADAKRPSEAERDSAPGLPSPPERNQPRLLDTTPSPRESGTTNPPPQKTRLGLDPVPARTSGQQPSIKDAITVPSGIHAVQSPAQSGSMHEIPPGKRPSVVPIVLGIIFVVAAAGAALWFFVLREPAVESMKPAGGGAGSTPIAKNPDGSANQLTPDKGSDDKGSAEQMTATNPDKGGGSGEKPTPPAGPTVDTVIASSVDKASVEVEGTDQKGVAPFTAKLEKDKAYKVKLSAPGYVTGEFDVKGGAPKVTEKLDAKKYVVTVNVTPAGAAMTVDGVMGKSPFEMKVAPKRAVTVRVAKGGYRPQSITIAADKWTEDATTMTFTQDVTLALAPVVVNNPPPDKGSGTPPDKGSGSETPPTGGSAETPPPPPPPPPAGGGAGSDPAPTWTQP